MGSVVHSGPYFLLRVCLKLDLQLDLLVILWCSSTSQCMLLVPQIYGHTNLSFVLCSWL
jgi:hypothetical protein